MIRRPWVVMRAWYGHSGVLMQPQPTPYRFWTRRRAEAFANRLTLGSMWGGEYHVERRTTP